MPRQLKNIIHKKKKIKKKPRNHFVRFMCRVGRVQIYRYIRGTAAGTRKIN